MRQTSSRSSSLQRGSRAASAKRGQRANTPSRRLSDLQERPAWDATSSNLDKYKLTAEELERRRASRVSKNRPLAADASRRSFVEAWAKHVTDGVLRYGGEEVDTEHDQDRPCSTPPASELPINYSNVVDMLRKSPRPTPSATKPLASPLVGTTTRGSTSPGSAGAGNDRSGRADQEGARIGSSTSENGAFSRRPDACVVGTSSLTSSPAGGAATRSSSEAAGGPAAAKGAGAAAAGGGGAVVHRAEISITPVTLRPRITPADTTTIIAFGNNSDDDGDGGDEGAEGHDGAVGDASPGRQLASDAGGSDPMTAAFEAALFGRRDPIGGGAAPAGLHLAWMSGRIDASPINSAAGDVERRLRALEAAVQATGAAGPSARGGSTTLLHEDVAELRKELHKVRQDNAKLRQELSTFSTHASTLLTQLQAQVQQLLRASGAGAASGPSTAATLPQPYTRQPPQPHQPAHGGATSTVPAQASFPNGLGLDEPYSIHMARQPPQQQPPSLQQQHPHQQGLLQQPVVRRNIFADIDISGLRPLGTSSRTAAGDAAPSTTATPHSVYGAGLGGGGAYSRQAEGTSVAASPPIHIPSAAQPYGVQPAPGGNPDDVEVPLPSFAAFRRSAGTMAFTSSRPTPSTQPQAQASLLSPSWAQGNSAAVTSSSPPAVAASAAAAVQQRTFPTQYHPRSLGGTIARPAPPLTATAGNSIHAGSGTANGAALLGSAAASAATATSGAYAAAMAASAAAAAATGSDAAAAGLARAHSGLPQPLVFSMGPEFRTARASGLSADNSMSLSAHTAAATAARSKASVGR